MLVLAAIGTARPVVAQGGEGDLTPRRGAAVYADFCQACHGPRGEARGTGVAFQTITYHADTARDVIANGRDSNLDDGAAMPPYAQRAGGLLSDRQIDDLIAYLETWQTGDTPPLPQPNLRDSPLTPSPIILAIPGGRAGLCDDLLWMSWRPGQGARSALFPAVQSHQRHAARCPRGRKIPPCPPSQLLLAARSASRTSTTSTRIWPPGSWTPGAKSVAGGMPALCSIMVGVGAILLVGAAYMVRPADGE